MLSKWELQVICMSLIEFGQEKGILPENTEELADKIQELAANEEYISKESLMAWMI